MDTRVVVWHSARNTGPGPRGGQTGLAVAAVVLRVLGIDPDRVGVVGVPVAGQWVCPGFTSVTSASPRRVCVREEKRAPLTAPSRPPGRGRSWRWSGKPARR
jgi:hypothetical protein